MFNIICDICNEKEPLGNALSNENSEDSIVVCKPCITSERKIKGNNLKGYLNYLKWIQDSINFQSDESIELPFNLHGDLRAVQKNLTNLINGLNEHIKYE